MGQQDGVDNLMFVTKDINLTMCGDRNFELIDDLIYKGKHDIFIVPGRRPGQKGFITDFASVPRILQWLVPTYGKYTLAAIVHDYLCVELFKYHNNPDGYMRMTDGVAASKLPPTTARNADGIFRRIMRELEVPFLRRWIMWTGVRWGAMFNAARRDEIWLDLPPMILWSIIASPIVIPISLCVGAGLLIDHLFEFILGRFLK